MSDSLVLGMIEVLSGGVPCGLPQCPNAIFRLGTGFSLSAPQWTSDKVAGLLLDGEQITNLRASNRQPVIPVTILVPSTGDIMADRTTLATAREILLMTCSQENWQLTWTRDGGDPLVFDCQGVSSTVVAYSQPLDWGLVSLVEISCEAFPFGHSEDQEAIALTSPSTMWDLPPAPVTLDDYNTASNYLQGNWVYSTWDTTTFDNGISTWLDVSGHATIARTTAQAHSGTGSLAVTCSVAGSMSVAHNAGANATGGQFLPVNPGDTVTVRGWWRAAATPRSVNIGADFYNNNGVQVGGTLRGSNVTDSTSAWTQVTASLTAPANAAYCRANAECQSPVLNEVHYLDDVWLDGGAIESAVGSQQWTQSTVVASGTRSARWSRAWHSAPTYDSPTIASSNITGRTKFTVFVGLATTVSQWSTWHRGTVHFSVTLYDASGNSITGRARRHCYASALSTAPHWQLVTIPIPQVASGFDYTTVSRYALTAWNKVDPGGGLVLQSGAFFNLPQAVATSTANNLTRGALHTLPGIIGSARGPLGIQCQPGPSSIASTAVFTTVGNNNWLCPAGVTLVSKAEAWGGGGGGAGSGGLNNNSNAGGGGGGGGEYAQEINMPVTAGNTYVAVVGAAGTHGAINNQGNNAGDSTFTAASGPVLRAHGGNGGATVPSNVRGGGGSGSTNYIHYSGGDGRPDNNYGETFGGGGGGSGGPTGAGNDGGHPGGASAVYLGGPGGDGGWSDPAKYNTGRAPSVGPGGGGGGGAYRNDNTNSGGGDGASGQVKLTYGASGIIPLVSLLAHMPDPEQPAALSPIVAVGNGADTPNGATEYTVPVVGGLAARFDGSYTVFLIGSGTWGSPTVSRTVTVQIRQYPYSGGTAITTTLSRTFTPSTDIVNGYVDMGQITLPLAEIATGNITAAYFTLTVTSGQTADRYLDVVFLDTQGQTVLINTTGTGWNNIWIDAQDREHDLGGVYGSDADRDRAYSLTSWVDRWPGGAFMVRPDSHNRLLLYAQQGCPAATLTYLPHYLVDRV